MLRYQQACQVFQHNNLCSLNYSVQILILYSNINPVLSLSVKEEGCNCRTPLSARIRLCTSVLYVVTYAFKLFIYYLQIIDIISNY